MIRGLFFSLFFILSHSGYSGGFTENLLRSEPVSVQKVNISKDSNRFYFSCEYARYEFEKTALLTWIEKYQIRKISLVYTKYKTAPSFDQVQLNRSRYNKLFSILPQLSNNAAIEWILIEQTGCNSREEGKDFFHGFILEGLPVPTTESMKAELSFIEKFLSEEVSDTAGGIPGGADIESSKDEKEKIRKCPSYNGGFPAFRSYIERNIRKPNVMGEYLREGFVTVQIKILSDGNIADAYVYESLYSWADEEALRLINGMPSWIPGSTDEKNEDYTMHLKIHFGRRTTAPVYQCIIPEDDDLKEVSSFVNTMFLQPDKTIPEILERNPDWKKMIIVCDVTGSMAKYNVTMFAWMKKRMEDEADLIRRVVFFNDGDLKSKKVIGETGGIYISDSRKFTDVLNTARECMQNGSGGDTPENNIEALIAGLKNISDIGEIILIADNFATPRDLDLIPLLKKPVRVIVCGGYNGAINLAYLNLARKTGGSVHTDKKDFYDLSKYKERESFSIGDFNYIIRKGIIELD